jgi:hypothetical protein
LRDAPAGVQDRFLLRSTLSLAAVAAALVPLPGFHSPTGNIQCFVVHGTLRCALASTRYGAALQANCVAPPTQLDWHGWELGTRTKGIVTCAGGILYDPETERPAFTALPYGRTWHRGAFTCQSRTTGITCRNRAGHGLFLSRETWRGW